MVNLFFVFFVDFFIDVDNIFLLKVVGEFEDVDSVDTFDEEIDCLILVDFKIVEDDVVDVSSIIFIYRFYLKINRFKFRLNVIIRLEELNVVKRKRRKKGLKLCMLIKRKRRRYVVIREYKDGFFDSICEFIFLVRYFFVDSGVDIMDNVDFDLFIYGYRYKGVME